MAEIRIEETEELPKCPHCGAKLTKILKNVKGMWERHVVYMCPECKKVLSIGNDTGFGN